MSETKFKIDDNLFLIYRDGRLWQVDKPLDNISIHFSFYNDVFYYKNGLPHRIGGPAIIYGNGKKRWFENGIQVYNKVKNVNKGKIK